VIKLPSIQYLTTQAKNSLLRFPLTIFASLIAVILGIYLVEQGEDISNIFPYINVMLSLSIGIPLYFCVTIIANKKKFDSKKILYSNLLATLVLIAIYFTLPNAESTHNTTLPYIKYGLYNMTCHLLVSIVPFAFSKQLNGFWHYNKILFLRILLSVLYSAFIYVGLIIALTALKLLFDIDIHEKLYFEIWIAIIGLFNTWFFVSGIPTDFDPLDEINAYPKGLRIFSQYVLLPLLGLYLLILYAYGTKILITSNWPKGIVAYLIIFVSILGILAFLLLYPYGNLKESSWIKKVSKGYYFVLIPLLVLLYIAIFMRINDYGITINRYAILALAIWITMVCMYTALGKTNIKFIPTSLAIITILISFGPWGMFSVSERSQVNRLRTILVQSKILVNGKIQNEAIWNQDSLPKFYTTNEYQNEGKLKDTLHNEVKSIIEYLDNHHGFSSIQSWYKQDVNALVDLQKKRDKNKRFYYENEAGVYMKSMGLKDEFINIDDKLLFNNYNAEEIEGFTIISGYDYLIDFDDYYGSQNLKIKSFKIDNTEFFLSYFDKKKDKLILKSKNDSFKFELGNCIQKLKNDYGNGMKADIPASSMQLTDANATFEVKLEFHSIQIEAKKDGDAIRILRGNIFIKKK
jgi:hypothetical protein